MDLFIKILEVLPGSLSRFSCLAAFLLIVQLPFSPAYNQTGFTIHKTRQKVAFFSNAIFDCSLFVFLWKSEMCLFKKKEATKKKPSTLQVTFCFHSFTLIKLSAITRLWMKNQSWKWWEVTLIHSWQRTAGQRGYNNSSEDAHPEDVLLTIHSAVLHSGNLHLGSNGKEPLQPLSDPMAQTHFH